jgi:hypothetical protein
MVQDAFSRAVQEHLQTSLRTGEDWDRYLAIKRETDTRILQELHDYKYAFAQRMAEAKQIILREENGLRLDQPLPSWAEKHSDADQLERKAGQRVQQDHMRRLVAIGQDETQAFRDLTAEIRARDAPAQPRPHLQTHTRTRSGPSQS